MSKSFDISLVEVAKFFVKGAPKAQARPRFRSCGNGRKIVYIPAAVQAWKKTIALCAAVNRPKKLNISNSMIVEVNFWMPRPKKNNNKNNAQHIIKPDIDNLVKVVLDALTLAKYWVDDSQVICLNASKIYAPQGSPPGVKVKILTPERKN
jgi:Holliday junction resolvase RusA-like endonuclease